MIGNSKNARHFFTIKKKEQEEDLKLLLSFIDPLSMLYKLRRKIVKIQAEIKSYDSIKQYTHNDWALDLVILNILRKPETMNSMSRQGLK